MGPRLHIIQFHSYDLLEKNKTLVTEQDNDCQGLGGGGEYDYKGAAEGAFWMVELYCILIVVVLLITLTFISYTKIKQFYYMVT